MTLYTSRKTPAPSLNEHTAGSKWRAKRGLEAEFQRELHHTRRAQPENARAQAQTIAALLACSRAERLGPETGAIERSASSVQDSAQRVGGSVKVGEIRYVEKRYPGLYGELIFHLVHPVQTYVEGAQPAHAGFVEGSRRDGLLHSPQGLQIRQALLRIHPEQVAIDQHLTRRSRLGGIDVVVLVDRLVDVVLVDAMPEGADVGSRQNVAEASVGGKTAVTGAVATDIRHEDAARASSGAQGEGHGQRAVEMSDHAHAEVQGQIHRSAERYLVLAIEPVRPQITLRVVEVGGDGDEVIVGRGRNIALQLIRNLQIKIRNSWERILQVLLQGQLHRVIFRVTDGEQHLVGADERVDARESGVGTWCSTTQRIAGIEAIGGEICDGAGVGIRSAACRRRR